MYVCHICARSLWRLDRDLRFSGLGVTHGYELPCGCWEPNPNPLHEHQVLLCAESVLHALRQ